jgi:hypothetical protein
MLHRRISSSPAALKADQKTDREGQSNLEELTRVQAICSVSRLCEL